MSEPTSRVTLLPGLANQITPAPIQPAQPQPVSGEKFTDMLSSMVNSVNDLQANAAQAQTALMNGEAVELHDVMIKAEQAGLSMDFLLEIRNKLVNAYNELTRMPM